MASLKELKARIDSTKSTQRITSAMKMVAAAKLKKAQTQAETNRVYASKMSRMLNDLAKHSKETPSTLAGTGSDKVQLLIIVTSDRGLCGGFNGSIVRDAKRRIQELEDAGKTVKLIIVGRKGVAQLKREYGDRIIVNFEEISKPSPSYNGADKVSQYIMNLFNDGKFDVCSVIYNKFISALSQEVTPIQLIPFHSVEDEDVDTKQDESESELIYDYEPSKDQILEDLVPRNITIQIYRSFLESFASEQGARMAAMDSATRNAGDMISSLSITYNRSRQAQITKELIEIISGAEAV